MALRGIDADVQASVEVQRRIALKAFSDTLLSDQGCSAFEPVMLIGGNDERGIAIPSPSRRPTQSPHSTCPEGRLARVVASVLEEALE